MDLNFIIKRSEHDSFLAIEWFESNKTIIIIKLKFHLLVSGYKNEIVQAKTENEKIWESNKQKLLGLDIDRNLNFNERVSSLFGKAGDMAKHELRVRGCELRVTSYKLKA